MTFHPVWLDEVYSFAMAQHSFVDIVALTAADVHPPLSFHLVLFALVAAFNFKFEDIVVLWEHRAAKSWAASRCRLLRQDIGRHSG